MSKERRDLHAAYGARLVLTPAEKGMQGAVDEANRLVKQLNGFCPSQFDNPANPTAHRATAEEIFEDLQGEVAALVACVGTGGTLCGSARALKARIPDLWTAAVEPAESPLLSGGQAGPHGIQGIGANFIPATTMPPSWMRCCAFPPRRPARSAAALPGRKGCFAASPPARPFARP